MHHPASSRSRRQIVQGLVIASLGLLIGCRSAVQPAAATPASDPTVVTSANDGPRLAANTPLSPPVTVRSGIVGSLAEAGQLIALERGYFQEQGLNVEFTQFDSTARMTPSLASGQLDVGAGGVGAALFNAIGRGVPIKIVGPQAQHDPGARDRKSVV